MKDLFISLLVSGVCIFLGGQFLPEVTVSNFQTALIAAGALGLANTFVRPILRLVSAPIRFVTLGGFSFVINGIILMLVAYLIDGFAIGGPFFGLLWAMALSFVISVLSTIFKMFGND